MIDWIYTWIEVAILGAALLYVLYRWLRPTPKKRCPYCGRPAVFVHCGSLACVTRHSKKGKEL